jgi:NADH dehydrogenase [ubiquinone] 1 alpha subcomplex assembly factor 1
MNLITLLFMSLIGSQILFDFQPNSSLENWYVVDDVVMGGRSAGQFSLTEAGHGLFQGSVSLENNGGFSSVRHSFPTRSVEGQQKFVLRVKGDGKRYQFRVRSSRYERFSYIAYFETTGEWQTVDIPFAEMYPSFRGMRLNRPNYPGEAMTEIAFLISNKKPERFRLEIDAIGLE